MASDEADIVLVGDFRFPGGTSTAVASEIAALHSAGYDVRLLPVASAFLSGRRIVHPEIAREIAAGHARMIAPGEPVRARLACFHHPGVFETYPSEPLHLSADKAVLVVHHPPVDAAGAAQYDMRKVRSVLGTIAGAEVPWGPVGPKVRAAFRQPNAPPLLAEEWVNTVDPRRFGGSRPGLPGGRPVIGRHSRPDPPKWPDSASLMRLAYPVAPDIRVSLMGFRPEIYAGFGALPANWRVQEFGAQPPETFLQSIDFFAHFHSSTWIEAFGRSILEAMAAGVVCLLPPDFEPLFGDGAVYCQPAEVLETVRAICAAPESYGPLSARAVALVEERFSPRIAIARVEKLIGPPRATAAPAPAKPRQKPRILYLTSNGVGMGHLTRVMACARRHREAAEPVVVSMSRAYSVARQEGMIAEYLPYFRSAGMEEARWQWTLRVELIEMLRFYRPRVVVLDGNVPYSGLLDALREFPEIWSVWMRRPMWPPDVGAHFLRDEPQFDAVIEPGELAADFDRGLTVARRGDARRVAPISFLREGEALDRGAARAVLGLDTDRPAAFLQLGAGNNLATEGLRRTVIETLTEGTGEGPPQIVLGKWRMGNGAETLPEHVTVLQSFPFARFLGAFDFSVAMAGYNTFHENIRAGLPTLFLGNEHPEQDEQWLRADYARVSGLALAARVADRFEVRRRLLELATPGRQQSLRTACRAISLANGADEAAAFLRDLAYTRRSHVASTAP